MKEITEASIRRFFLDKYRKQIGEIGLMPDNLADDFDFLLNGRDRFLWNPRDGQRD